MSISTIIVAGGNGTRLNSSVPKQYLKILDKEVIIHTIEKFEMVKEIEEIIIVVSKEYLKFCINTLEYYKIKNCKIVCGGETRQQSVYNGLQNVKEGTKIVLVHDSVRPFINKDHIYTLIKETSKDMSCAVGVKVKDTIKVCNHKNEVLETPNRDMLWSIQTPQCFSFEVLKKAHDKAKEEDFIGTDDCSLVERIGGNIKIIEGSYKNIKITTKEDLVYCKFILESEKG